MVAGATATTALALVVAFLAGIGITAIVRGGRHGRAPERAVRRHALLYFDTAEQLNGVLFETATNLDSIPEPDRTYPG